MNSKCAIVVPSCRKTQALEFVDAWKEGVQGLGDACLYIVEDGPSQTFEFGDEEGEWLRHLSWADAPAGMLECITVRSPGCRQIGFWQAYRDGCEIIITLDDDVRPLGGTGGDGCAFLKAFCKILSEGVPLWIDPLQNYRSRGYPVENTGTVPVQFHVGCFAGIPDVDGETQLEIEAGLVDHPPRYLSRPVVAAPGQLLPINGGICGWQRQLTPYVHYTLWHAELAYRRYDDIWMGILLKRILDLSGRRMSYGPPAVHHQRASDAIANRGYERAGKVWNESFWQILDQRILELQANENGESPLPLDRAADLVVSALEEVDNSWAVAEAGAMRAWERFFHE